MSMRQDESEQSPNDGEMMIVVLRNEEQMID